MSPHSLNWPPPSWNTLIYRCGSHAAAKRANIIIMVKISQKIIMVKRERERETDGPCMQMMRNGIEGICVNIKI